MSRTSINVAAVSSARNTISKASSNVVNVLNSFRSTKSNVDSKIQNRNNIGAKLNSVQNQLNSIVSEPSPLFPVLKIVYVATPPLAFVKLISPAFSSVVK